MVKTGYKLPLIILPIILLGALLFTYFNCPSTTEPVSSGYTYRIPEETDDGWKTDSLSSVDMDTRRLEDLVDKIRDNSYREVHSVVIVKNGKLVFEAYFPGHDFGQSSQNYLGTMIQSR